LIHPLCYHSTIIIIHYSLYACSPFTLECYLQQIIFRFLLSLFFFQILFLTHLPFLTPLPPVFRDFESHLLSLAQDSPDFTSYSSELVIDAATKD